MSRPATLDLACVQGDDFSFIFNFFTAAQAVADISTWSSITAQIRGASSNTSFVMDVTGLADGIIVISLAAATTTAMTPDSYSWDLQRTLSSKRRTIFKGKFTLDPQVTT